ncbi:MAG: ABC transporter substrate-binding protein [Candidatus Thorarchaeota archaeon]
MSDNLLRKLIGSIFLLSLLLLPFLPIAASAQESTYSFNTGPFVNKILYRTITQDDQQVLALQDDEIDVIGDMVDPSFFDTLLEANNIEFANVLRNGYGYFTINCDKYPLNITAFRRAFAFALDKKRISDDVWDGLSVPQDSCIPQCNPFSIEGQLSYDYYESNTTLANQLLDSAGFEDVNEDGIREAPDGSEFEVKIWSSQTSNIAIEIGEIGVGALQAIGVNASIIWEDWYPYHPWHPPWGRNYDMVFLGSSFNNFDIDWLAYEFWSEYADEPYWNIPNWKNLTFDSWRDQLIHSVSYEEVYEAAIEMQRTWVYECPMVVTYENVLLSAYRTDRFNGFVNDAQDGVPSWWTNYKVHLKDEVNGPFGGTLRIGNPLDIDTFNFMESSSVYSMKILDMLYDSLIRLGPDGLDIPWLAESYKMEIFADNPAISEGYTRITFDITRNATWSDGEILTGNDVAFTLNYYRDSLSNPYGADLTEMTAAYAPNPFSVIVEFNTESYWHLHTVGYKPILPKHVFEDIGAENWNPDPPTEAMVTSGPFNVSEYVQDDYVELTYNPNYFYGPERPPVSDDTETTTTNGWNIDSMTLTSGIVTGVSICVIVIVLAVWKLQTNRVE